MFDPSLTWPVLRLLDRWGRLPLSDVERLLGPLERPRFRVELLEDMERNELVRLYPAGDELVAELTPRGRSRLGGGQPAPGPSNGPVEPPR